MVHLQIADRKCRRIAEHPQGSGSGQIDFLAGPGLSLGAGEVASVCAASAAREVRSRPVRDLYPDLLRAGDRAEGPPPRRA
ncbi:MAG: hypothetical protein Q4P33_08425 [Flaviflexus sp.]|nr:hypothetical protein [Flaviflexus sp.]